MNLSVQSAPLHQHIKNNTDSTDVIENDYTFSEQKTVTLTTDLGHVLGIHDLFGTELAMTSSFHVGLTDSVMQRMQLFFLSVSARHFLATALPDL
jgi:hypothetical protein